MTSTNLHYLKRMLRATFLTVAVSVLLTGTGRSAETGGQSEYMFYLTPDRLIAIQLDILIDGQTLQAAQDKFIDRLYSATDANGDGVISGKEIRTLPNADVLARAGIVPRAQGKPADRNRDGKVTRIELVKYVKDMGLGRLVTRANTSRETGRNASRFRPESSERPSVNLFSRLDADRNEKLSAEELRTAIETLRKIDLDDDETIGVSELRPLTNPYRAVPQRRSQQAATPATFITVSAAGSPRNVVRLLLTRYDSTSPSDDASSKKQNGKDNALSQREIGLSSLAFSQADADRNGLLDFTELSQYVRQPTADLHVVIRIGKREPREAPFDVTSRNAQFQSSIRTTSAGAVAIVLGKAQIEFNARSPMWALDNTSTITAQFKQLDGDSNGYLERREVAANRRLVETFVSIDTDGDGKVFLKEMLAFMQQLLAAAQSQTILTMGAAGRSLFEILDSNRDNRISRREFQTAANRLELWDADGDKQVSQTELPTQRRVTVARGTVAGLASISQSARRADGISSVVSSSAGPVWFRKMDFNLDGDISRREFIGSRQQFEQFDADSDGLIDSTEANARQQSTPQ